MITTTKFFFESDSQYRYTPKDPCIIDKWKTIHQVLFEPIKRCSKVVTAIREAPSSLHIWFGKSEAPPLTKNGEQESNHGFTSSSKNSHHQNTPCLQCQNKWSLTTSSWTPESSSSTRHQTCQACTLEADISPIRLSPSDPILIHFAGPHEESQIDSTVSQLVNH